jgi:hypothetical protein
MSDNNKFTDVKDNICEICGRQATAGILDDERYTNTRIRYTCEDHAMKVFERIASETRERGATKSNDSKK